MYLVGQKWNHPLGNHLKEFVIGVLTTMIFKLWRIPDKTISDNYISTAKYISVNLTAFMMQSKQKDQYHFPARQYVSIY